MPLQIPETCYASGDVAIGYQVLGDGPVDFVWVSGMMSNIEYEWAEPQAVRAIRGFGLDRADGKVSGLAVHIGARVLARAGPGEVLVSQTVKDLVAGSGIEFAEHGTAELKGVPREWKLYAVADS
jgi:hypothetical protein